MTRTDRKSAGGYSAAASRAIVLRRADDLDTLQAWPAFVDLLAATALLFLTMVVLVAVTKQQQIDGIQTTLRDLEARVVALDGYGRDFRARSDSQFLRIILEEEATFPRNDYVLSKLRPQGRETLRSIGLLLTDPSLVKLYREVRVVGHTDRKPYKLADFSNWELSSMRAAVVARFLVDNVGMDPCRVSASGVASYYPVDGPDGAGSNVAEERNRRIELEIVPRPVGAEDVDAGCDPAGDGTVAAGSGR